MRTDPPPPSFEPDAFDPRRQRWPIFNLYTLTFIAVVAGGFTLGLCWPW